MRVKLSDCQIGDIVKSCDGILYRLISPRSDNRPILLRMECINNFSVDLYIPCSTLFLDYIWSHEVFLIHTDKMIKLSDCRMGDVVDIDGQEYRLISTQKEPCATLIPVMWYQELMIYIYKEVRTTSRDWSCPCKLLETCHDQIR